MKLLAAAAAMLILAGCSSASPEATAPTTTAAPTTTTVTTSVPAPTPTVWTLEEARANYLAAVKPGNALLDELNKLYKAQSTDLAAWQSVCSRLVKDYDKLARAMVAGLWPDVAKQPVAAFAQAVNKERADFQSCAAAPSMDVVGAAMNAITGEGTTAAQGVRIALGLPGTEGP